MEIVRDSWPVFAGLLGLATGYTGWMFNMGQKLGMQKRDMDQVQKNQEALKVSGDKEATANKEDFDRVHSRIDDIQVSQNTTNSKLDLLIGKFEGLGRN